MKILYGVPGEGMGHATRSKVVITHLLDSGHDVHVVASDRAYTFLKQSFPDRVSEIKGFHFAYKNAEVSKAGTFWLNLKAAPKNLILNIAKQLQIEKNFTPELVISDFESFTYFFAKLHKLPLISIDNMQVMNRCVLDIPIAKEEKNNYQLAKQIVKAKVPGCDHYLISSFFDAKISKKNTQLVQPIIRQAILDTQVSEKDHILVYQTSSSLKNLQETLSKLPNEKFLVYGMNKDQEEGNVCFKTFSEDGFIKDFSEAKAVIANGGFSFISEAVYLKKPIYSFPIANQFEQYMNAAYIEKLGYGRHFDKLNSDSIKAFLYELPLFKKQLSNYHQKGNEVLFLELDTLLQLHK
ncbi:MAG: UDP-glucuronosyltransferase [Bacteroidia bacterium]|nr:UDP-glucuronosyltransferase [Bacteroidia bacterium]MCF8427464.1 UDP-glucuronosyltransferase [Bacteroidia bacterium]